MAFQIIRKQFGKYELFQLIDGNCQTSVSIIPGCGALLNSFEILKNGTTLNLINGYKSAIDLDQNLHKNFKGVILSPFANRVNHATYNFNNNQYTLNKVWKEKDYAIHGYLYNAVFQVLSDDVNNDKAELLIKNRYDGSLPGYPFCFETTVVYTLMANNRMDCETIIQNTGKEIMPLSFGWHPLFFNEIKIEDVELQFNSDYKIEVDHEGIPSGITTAYETFSQGRKIQNTFFDYCFKLSEGKSVTVKLIEPLNKIHVELNIETGDNQYKYLQIYTPPQRNTIALEPMSSWPDAYNNQNDLIRLAPGESISMSYGIKISVF